MTETAHHTPCRAQTGFVSSPFYGLVPLDFLVRGEDHPCPYLPENTAREEVFRAVDFPPELYHDFMNYGFRRSGMYFYRPACEACGECQSIRYLRGLPPCQVPETNPQKNQDVEFRIALQRFKDKFGDLFRLLGRST
jgi:arginine-tRNA-protein transferase